jgi:hypothetical protein
MPRQFEFTSLQQRVTVQGEKFFFLAVNPARSIGTSNASFILHAERTPTRGSGSQSTLSRLLITARRGLAAYPSFDIGFTVSRGRVSQSTLRHLMP